MPKKSKTPPELSILFKLKPDAAIEYLENKGYKITNDWREMWEDAHAKAFTISKMTDMKLLKDTKSTLERLCMRAGARNKHNASLLICSNRAAGGAKKQL